MAMTTNGLRALIRAKNSVTRRLFKSRVDPLPRTGGSIPYRDNHPVSLTSNWLVAYLVYLCLQRGVPTCPSRTHASAVSGVSLGSRELRERDRQNAEHEPPKFSRVWHRQRRSGLDGVVLPTEYRPNVEKAMAYNPELAATYLRHTLIGDPLMDEMAEELAPGISG